MKVLQSIAAALILLTVLDGTVVAEDALPEADPDAIYTVEQYLSYLVVGDVQNLLHYLSSAMTKHRNALLRNPAYSSDLAAEYAGAWTEIMGSQQLNPDQAQVDARINYSNGEAMGVRFLVSRTKNGYLISSEY